MTSLWKVGIRPQSERNIISEYRLFESRYVTLKSYMKKYRILVSVDSKILWWPATIIYSPSFHLFTFRNWRRTLIFTWTGYVLYYCINYMIPKNCEDKEIYMRIDFVSRNVVQKNPTYSEHFLEYNFSKPYLFSKELIFGWVNRL